MTTPPLPTMREDPPLDGEPGLDRQASNRLVSILTGLAILAEDFAAGPIDNPRIARQMLRATEQGLTQALQLVGSLRSTIGRDRGWHASW